MKINPIIFNTIMLRICHPNLENLQKQTKKYMHVGLQLLKKKMV